MGEKINRRGDWSLIAITCSKANWLSYRRSIGDVLTVLSYFWQYYAAGELSGSHSLIFVENAEEMLLPWKNNPNFVPIVLTHVITFVIGLAGNIVVISTMSRGHGERSVTRSVRFECYVSLVPLRYKPYMCCLVDLCYRIALYDFETSGSTWWPNVGWTY